MVVGDVQGGGNPTTRLTKHDVEAVVRASHLCNEEKKRKNKGGAELVEVEHEGIHKLKGRVLLP